MLLSSYKVHFLYIRYDNDPAAILMRLCLSLVRKYRVVEKVNNYKQIELYLNIRVYVKDKISSNKRNPNTPFNAHNRFSFLNHTENRH